MQDWIGKIRFPNGAEATLKTSGKWECPQDPDLAKMLELSYSIGDLPALGLPSGWSVVSQAAAKLGGKAEFPFKLKPLEDGEVS